MHLVNWCEKLTWSNNNNQQKRSKKPAETCRHSDSTERLSNKTCVFKSPGGIIMIIIIIIIEKKRDKYLDLARELKKLWNM